MSGEWRIGRSLGRTLYIQIGKYPSKQDTFIGIMDTKDLAQQVVDSVNRDLEDGKIRFYKPYEPPTRD